MYNLIFMLGLWVNDGELDGLRLKESGEENNAVLGHILGSEDLFEFEDKSKVFFMSGGWKLPLLSIVRLLACISIAFLTSSSMINETSLFFGELSCLMLLKAGVTLNLFMLWKNFESITGEDLKMFEFTLYSEYNIHPR